MKYASLYGYLDEVFKGKQATKAEIKQAKRTYWKMWYCHYRREERKRKRDFNLRFHPDEIQRMDEKRGDLSYSQFLYQAVRRTLISTKEPSVDPKQFASINQNLMQIINLLEELIDTGGGELAEDILAKMEQLEEKVRHFTIEVQL